MSRRKEFFPEVTDQQWNDWHWQVANRAETLEDLKKYITLTPEEEEGVKACLGTLRMAITPYYLSLIQPGDPHDPVRLQAIPTAKELHQSPTGCMSGFASRANPVNSRSSQQAALYQCMKMAVAEWRLIMADLLCRTACRNRKARTTV